MAGLTIELLQIGQTPFFTRTLEGNSGGGGGILEFGLDERDTSVLMNRVKANNMIPCELKVLFKLEDNLANLWEEIACQILLDCIYPSKYSARIKDLAILFTNMNASRPTFNLSCRRLRLFLTFKLSCFSNR